MEVIQVPKQFQSLMLSLKQQGKKIGFVPTMGNLHSGHLSLIDIAKSKADIIVASIFVNPMQFGPNEDFDSYPRTMKADLEKLEAKGTDYVFTPTIEQVYPLGKEVHTSVEANRLTDKLCGASRPGHFKGVTTVVNMLFNIVQPNVAIFGKKDYQQLQVIKTMVSDLLLPIEIIGGDIVREDNGLAMSSRNGYLSEEELNRASELRKIILSAAEAVKNRLPLSEIKSNAKSSLSEAGFKVDYFDIVRQHDLEDADLNDKQLLIAAAAWLGQPRLIDNIEVNLTDELK